MSFDVDALVRPADVSRLLKALGDLGWEKLTGFEEGSAFGHAMNLRHDLGLIAGAAAGEVKSHTNPLRINGLNRR